MTCAHLVRDIAARGNVFALCTRRTTPATVLSSLLGTVGFVADLVGIQSLLSLP